MKDQTEPRAFPFLELNERDDKPRSVGLTEIRGPYYSMVGPSYLRDALDVAGEYIDSFKFGGAVMPLLRRSLLSEYLDICHGHGVQVSTGGLVEFVLTQGTRAVHRYLDECRDLGFDIVEISVGMVSVPFGDYLRLVESAKKRGFSVKAEIGVQFGAGGTSSVSDLASEGITDPGWAVQRARAALDAGADLIMLESEGITEQVEHWRTDVPAAFIRDIGIEQVMFEAAEPPVFNWYVKNYGPEVNLFIDHSQILHLETLRSGIWGTTDVWGRIRTFKG